MNIEVKCPCGNEFYIETENGVPKITICPHCVKKLNKQIKDKENVRKSEVHRHQSS